MATDQKFDLTTGDYVDDGVGGWVEEDSSATAVWLQLECEARMWWGDSDCGSENARISRSELPTLAAYIDSTRRALGQLAGVGMISGVSVAAINDGPAIEAEQASRGFGDMQILWTDRATGQPADLFYSPLGGNPTVV